MRWERKAVGALALTVASASAGGEEQRLLGAWSGATEWGAQAETVIESIGEGGAVRGTVCEWYPSGHIMGERMRGVESAPYDGWDVTARVGDNLVVHSPWYDGGVRRLVTNRSARGEVGSAYTEMARAPTLRCAHLFAGEPRALEDLEGETGEGIVGYWHGRTVNGSDTELLIEHVTPRGEALGRLCWRSLEKNVMGIWDLYPGGPIKSRWEEEPQRLTVDAHTSARMHVMSTFTVLDEKRLTLEGRIHPDTAREQVAHTTYWRGKRAGGCLSMSYLNAPWKGIGDAGATHPQLGQMGQRIARRAWGGSTHGEHAGGK